MKYDPKKMRTERVKVEVPSVFFAAVTGYQYDPENPFHRWVFRRMGERLGLLRLWRQNAIRLRYGLHDGYQYSHVAIERRLDLKSNYNHEMKKDLAWICKGLPTITGRDGTEHAVEEING